MHVEGEESLSNDQIQIISLLKPAQRCIPLRLFVFITITQFNWNCLLCSMSRHEEKCFH